MKLSSISFLIPAYNDEKTIEKLIDETNSVGATAAQAFEIVVLNDASSDSTGAILSKLAKKHAHLRVITHIKNGGYGEAIKALYYAGNHEWLFSLPGDFQIHPSEIVKLIPATQNADMIIGKREYRMDSLSRRRQSQTYNRLLHLLYRLPLSDVNSVRLMKRSMMLTIRLTSHSAFVDAELAIRADRMGYRIAEVPIVHKTREGSVGAGGKLHVILPTIVEMIGFKIGLI